MSTDWVQGETARLSIQATDPAGLATDFPDIVLKTISPSGSLSTLTLTPGQIEHAGTGDYFADLHLTTAGHWYWRWDASGSAIEGHLSVQPSRFA